MSIYNVECLALSTEGFGVCKINYNDSIITVFVPGLIPGEHAEVELLEVGAKVSNAQLVKLLSTVPERVNPPCPYYPTCGGCQLQHIDITAQRKYKLDFIRHTLERYYKLNIPEVSDCSSGLPAFNYRNRVVLHRRAPAIGFYRTASNDLVSINECLLLEQELNQFIKDNDCFKSEKQSIQGIVLGKTESEVSAKFLNVERKLIGEDDLLNHFSQVNSLANQKITEIILDNLDSDLLTEFYAGSGNFTFELAKKVKKLLAVEADKKLVEHAKQKIKNLAIKNLDFINSTTEIFIKNNQIEGDVLLDPPRAGASKLVSVLKPVAVKKIVYVSCNIATLGRDLKTFVTNGYQIEKICFVDMFPQTKHVETVSVLKAL